MYSIWIKKFHIKNIYWIKRINEWKMYICDPRGTVTGTHKSVSFKPSSSKCQRQKRFLSCKWTSSEWRQRDSAARGRRKFSRAEGGCQVACMLNLTRHVFCFFFLYQIFIYKKQSKKENVFWKHVIWKWTKPSYPTN